jgi:gluconolactonase
MRRAALGCAVVLLVARVTAAETRPEVGRIERFDARLDALVPPGAFLEQVVDDRGWTEGPLWDPGSGSLLFSDVPRNVVVRWTRDAGTTVELRASGYTGPAPFPGREPGSNGLAFDREGRLVLCQHGDRRIARREHDGRLVAIVERVGGKRLNSPNDLVFHPNGDLWFTDPPFGLPGAFDDPAKELPYQGVFRVTPDGAVTPAVTDLRAPNGIAFSPDGRTLYVSNADAAEPVWMAYPVRDDGTVGTGRELARAVVRDGESVPDGLEVDAYGNLFAAGPGGVHVFAPDGTRLGRIETGVKTGNVAWGDDGSTLYVAANHWVLRLRTTTRGAIGFAAR